MNRPKKDKGIRRTHNVMVRFKQRCLPPHTLESSRMWKYLKYWCNREFKAVCDSQTLEQIAEVIQGYTRFNHNCKPEAMKPDTYHPVHDAEAERQLERIKKIDETLEKINAVMAEEMQPVIFLFCQKQIYSGMAMGAVKE